MFHILAVPLVRFKCYVEFVKKKIFKLHIFGEVTVREAEVTMKSLKT